MSLPPTHDDPHRRPGAPSPGASGRHLDAESRPRGRRLALALGLAALLVLASAASALGGGIEIESCNADGSECQSSDAELEEQPGGGGGKGVTPIEPGGGGGGGSQSAGGEIHDLGVGSEDSTTRRGGRQATTIDLENEDSEIVDESLAGKQPTRGGEADQPPTLDAPDGGGGRPKVSTGGGSPFSGFGSGLSFVAKDQVLSSFAIPPFLLPIYVAAGRAYDVPWNVLASINQIETDFGRIRLQVSYAGAEGWMQFMPGTWAAYGVDASGDGVADPYNPVDAIYAAARYLAASGASTDLRRAVFAYNHADWYVDRVLETASIYGSLPSGLVAETGSLAFGRFPVRGEVTYGDDFRRAQQAGRDPGGLRIFGRSGAPAIATQQVEVVKVLLPERLLERLDPDRRPTGAARGGLAALAEILDGVREQLSDAVGSISTTLTGLLEGQQRGSTAGGRTSGAGDSALSRATDSVGDGKREGGGKRAKDRSKRGSPVGYGATDMPGVGVVVEDSTGNRFIYEGLKKLDDVVRPGSRIEGGERLGRLRGGDDRPLRFSVRGANGAPVDPRPLVDGYRLQEAADLYGAVESLGKNPFVPEGGLAGELSTVGPVSGTQKQLARRVLNDDGLQIYECGRRDIANGIVDARLLGALLTLRRAGLTMTITSLRCGHGYYTAGGNVSAHSYGAAVDIAAFNGQPVIGNQGPGSLIAQAIRLLMRLEGEAAPSQLISLMDFGGPSFSLPDHADHLHVGFPFETAVSTERKGKALDPITFNASGPGATSRPGKGTKSDEARLSDRFAGIANPKVDSRRSGSPSAVHVETESPSEQSEARRLAKREFPLLVEAAAAPAKLVDVAVPGGGTEEKAYAIGVVDGAAREGWAPRQTVLLRNDAGTWSLLGPPRDGDGEVTDPSLAAIAVGKGGAGYAVGDDGAVVALDPERKPKELNSGTDKRLDDVGVAADGRSGYAVGPRGTLIRLTGKRAEAERLAGSAKPDLAAVAIADDGTTAAAGSTVDGSPVLYERDGGWSAAELGFGIADDTEVALESLAFEGSKLWIGGELASSGDLSSTASQPLLARRDGGKWTTFCAGDPSLAHVRELGESTRGSCQEPLSTEVTETGPIVAIAAAEQGVIAATRQGLHLLDAKTGFRALPSQLSSIAELALSPAGEGWAVAGAQLARIAPTAGPKANAGGGSAIELAAGEEAGEHDEPGARDEDRTDHGTGGPGAPAVIAAARRQPTLALGSAMSASIDADGSTEQLEGVGLGVRDAAWLGEEALAIDETGAALRFDGEQFDLLEDGEGVREARQALIDALGDRPLLDREDDQVDGLVAVAAASDVEAYAVGAEGRIARYLLGSWSEERTPTGATLRDVAAGPGGVVAVGDSGTVLTLEAERWSTDSEAAELVDGADLDAVYGLSDGSFIVAAGGALIERPAGAEDWRAAEVAPLGGEVRRLAAFREEGELRVVALVGTAEGGRLIVGSDKGWMPLEGVSGAIAVADMAPAPGSGEIVAVGTRRGSPVATRIEVSPVKEGS